MPSTDRTSFVAQDQDYATKCARCGFSLKCLLVPPLCSVCWDAIFRV